VIPYGRNPSTGRMVIAYQNHPVKRYGNRLAIMITVMEENVARRIAPHNCHVGRFSEK